MSARLWRGAIGAALTSALLQGCMAPAASSAPAAQRSSASTPSTQPAGIPSPDAPTASASEVEPRSTAGAPGRQTSEAPAATLSAGGMSFAGEVGGFDFRTATQSAPWLPASALDVAVVPAGSRLRVDLDAQATIAEWAASYAAADDTAGDDLVPLGSGPAPASFDAPPPGDWVLSVTIVFGDGAGSGAYYWHVAVE